MATAESVWNNCLKLIKDNIQIQAYKTWFELIKPIKFENNVLSVQVTSKFFYEWLEEHYVKLLKLALNKELGENARLIYVIKMENTYGNVNPYTEKMISELNGSFKKIMKNDRHPIFSLFVISFQLNRLSIPVSFTI